MPGLQSIITLETVIGNVVGEETEHALRVHFGAELDVVLLGRDHGQVLLLLASVLAELDTPHVLLVDEVGGDGVFGGIVPGGKDLLAEEETPGRVALLRALLLGVLLALADGVHDVVAATAQ